MKIKDLMLNLKMILVYHVEEKTVGNAEMNKIVKNALLAQTHIIYQLINILALKIA